MKGERVVGGLRCSEVLAQLDAFVDGSIATEAREKVMEHVSGCGLCERFGGTYAEVTRRIRGALREDEPEAAVLARLHARLQIE